MAVEYYIPTSGNVSANSRNNRPLITLDSGKVKHNGVSCRVVLRKGMISVGCSDVTPEAARFLLDEYEKSFPEPITEIVLQE